jgi:gamma-glutamyltranspeptidase/glutathione hydrolase
MMRSQAASAAIIALLAFTNALRAQDRSYGRSVVSTPFGIVATSEVQASQAGAKILERGGSAIDAGIAANAVLGVVEPMMNGIGGDLFAIYYDARTGKLTGINASGWAPAGLTIEHLKSKGIDEMPQAGIDAVTVPGAVDGWAKLHSRFGKLPWRELFQHAIFFAREGFAVPEIMDDDWKASRSRLLANPETKRVYLPDGVPPERGQLFRNPDLSRALTLIAEQGESALYKGEIAAAILKTSVANGGTMNPQDLAGYSAEWVDPIDITYRGWRVFELPPNGDGFAALEMLNIMEQFQPDPAGPASLGELHTRIEAMKLAYADVKAANGDPRFSKIPLDEITSKSFAKKRASLIDPDHANCDVPPAALSKSDTTYFTVVDRDGNILSMIQSNYSSFGSTLTVQNMGFLLHNRGAAFSLDPNSPNALRAHKRPFHTIIPAFMQKGERHIGFGIMGGMNQPLAHAQFVSNVVDYDMNIQEALETARFTVSSQLGCHILIESRVGPAIDSLARKGHILEVRKEYTANMGRGNAVEHDAAAQMNFAASDPRADGAAIPESPADASHPQPSGGHSKTHARKP